MKVKAEVRSDMRPALRLRTPLLWTALALLPFSGMSARAQTCQTSGDLDDATRSAITSSGQRYFAMAAKGDAASLRQNAIPSLASDFAGIESSVKGHQEALAGGQPTVKA